MNYQEAYDFMMDLKDEMGRKAKDCRTAVRAAERYAKRRGMKLMRDGETTIIYKPGSERAIVISRNLRGGIHMDVVLNPVYEYLDMFDGVAFA